MPATRPLLPRQNSSIGSISSTGSSLSFVARRPAKVVGLAAGLNGVSPAHGQLLGSIPVVDWRWRRVVAVRVPVIDRRRRRVIRVISAGRNRRPDAEADDPADDCGAGDIPAAMVIISMPTAMPVGRI